MQHVQRLGEGRAAGQPGPPAGPPHAPPGAVRAAEHARRLVGVRLVAPEQARPPTLAAGKVVGAIGSVVVHIAILAVSAFYLRVAPPPAPEEFLPIELEALGTIQGEINGAGTPNQDLTTPPQPHKEAPRAPQPDLLPPPPSPTAPLLTAPAAAATDQAPDLKTPDPTAKPPPVAAAASSAPVVDPKEAEREAMREAVRKAMLDPSQAPPSPVAGTGTAAPKGSPTGVAGGTARPRVSAKYAGILDGWFSSRVSLRGLDLPWDELKTLHATVTISLSPDRHVTGFSMSGSSGNGAYDARVQSSMQAVVSSGATLPEPPDGEDVPPSITLVFRCRTQERCS